MCMSFLARLLMALMPLVQLSKALFRLCHFYPDT